MAGNLEDSSLRDVNIDLRKVEQGADKACYVCSERRLKDDFWLRLFGSERDLDSS